MSRNEHARALHHRAGNAGVAVAVDTRKKVIPSKRKRKDRQAVRQALRKGEW